MGALFHPVAIENRRPRTSRGNDDIGAFHRFFSVCHCHDGKLKLLAKCFGKGLSVRRRWAEDHSVRQVSDFGNCFELSFRMDCAAKYDHTAGIGAGQILGANGTGGAGSVLIDRTVLIQDKCGSPVSTLYKITVS